MFPQPADESSLLALLTIVLYQILISCEGLCCLGWAIFFSSEVKSLAGKGDIDEVSHLCAVLEKEGESTLRYWDL